jgi:hypothetical protein
MQSAQASTRWFTIQQFSVKRFLFGKMSAQRVQVMARVTGDTFQVPLS